MFAFTRLTSLGKLRSAGIKAAEKQNKKIELAGLPLLGRLRAKATKFRVFVGCVASYLVYR